MRNHYGKIKAKTISGDITAAGQIMGFTGETVVGRRLPRRDRHPGRDPRRAPSPATSPHGSRPDVAAQYKINSVSGRLQLDDSEITRRCAAATPASTATLDKHWLELRVNTVSGNISVLHKVDA